MNDLYKSLDPIVLDSQSDRRQFPRKVAESTFVAGSISGRLVNMSESGLGLETEKPLPVLKQGMFTLDIGKARPKFRGEVRWCRLTGTAAATDGDSVPVYRAGIALVI